MSTGASSTLRARGHPPAVGATPVEGKLPGGSSACAVGGGLGPEA